MPCLMSTAGRKRSCRVTGSVELSHVSVSVGKVSRLTRLLEAGAPLVDGGAQAGSADVVETGFLDASVEHAQQGLLFLPLGQDFIVDEGGEHLGLDEATQERQVRLGLI